MFEEESRGRKGNERRKRDKGASGLRKEYQLWGKKGVRMRLCIHMQVHTCVEVMKKEKTGVSFIEV